MAVLAYIVPLLLAGGAWALEPAKGVFESCPACKLNSMPELKRFFHESVLKGEYGDRLNVKFIPGATPKLILYGADGKELSREDVSDKLKVDELHSWVQGKGFKKAATVAQEGVAQAKAPATAAPIPADADRPQQRLRGGAAGPVQRRRRLIPVVTGQRSQGGAAADGGGVHAGQAGALKRRRRRKTATGEYGGVDASARLRRRRRRAVAAGPGAEARH